MANKSENRALALKMASKQINFQNYKNEKNLMKFPFCSTSKRKRTEPIIYKSDDGTSLEVTANTTYGMAKIWDFDIIRYAISKAAKIEEETGIFNHSVEFTAYECLKALNRDPKAGVNTKWFRDALDRLVSTTYKTNIFGDESKKRVQGFTLIKYDYTESKKGIEKIRLTFDERLLNSISFSNNLLKINNRLLKEEAGIKKRLLELIDVNTIQNESKTWLVDLEELQKLCANSWSMARFKYEISTYSDLPWSITFYKDADKVYTKFSGKAEKASSIDKVSSDE